MGKALALIIAAVIITASLYMLYGGGFTSITSHILPSSSPSEKYHSSTTITQHVSVTSTTELSPVITSHTSGFTESSKTISTSSQTHTEAEASEVATTSTETRTTQSHTTSSANAAEPNEELTYATAKITHLFSVNVKPLIQNAQVFLYTNETHIIAGGRGLIVSIAFYKPESMLPSYEIVPVGKYKPTTILADYAYVSNSLTLLVVKLSKILHVVSPGKYTVIVWSGYSSSAVNALECKAIVERSKILFDDVKIHGNPAKISCSMVGGEDAAGYLTSLICYFDPSILEKVKNVIYSRNFSESVQEKIWKALEWIDRNIIYDYDKSKEASKYINNPLTTIEEGKGICIDYSVLVASALLSVNVQPVYILSLEDYQHAVAAVCLNGTIFILDQHIPPMELQDYVEYVLKGKLGRVNAIQVRLAGGSPIIEIVNDIKLDLRDSYPNDSVPDKLNREIATAIAKTYPNLLPDPKLSSLITTGLLRAKLAIKSPVLAGIETSSNVPITVYYNPLFEVQWADYLAGEASELMSRYYANVVRKGGYFWVAVENGSIYLAATAYRVPNTTLTLQGSQVIIEIRSQETLTSVSVLFYRPGEVKPIAGIAPEGYVYSGMTTITAKVWDVGKFTAKIVFTTQDVAEKLAHGKYTLAIWINGKIAWGTWYEV